MQRRVCRLHVYVNFEVFIKSISHFWILWTASLFVDKGPVLIENQHRILSFIQDFGTQTNSYRCYNMVNLRNLARSLSNNSLYDDLQSPHPDDLDNAEIEVSRDGIEGKEEHRKMLDASEREALVHSTRLPERFGRRRSMGDKSTSFRLLSKEQSRSRDNRTEEEKLNDSFESIPDIHVAASTVFKLEPSATSEKKSLLLLGEGTSLLDCAAAAQPPMIKPSTSSRRLTRGPSTRKLLRAQSSRKVMGERSRSMRQLDSNTTTSANKNDLRRQNSTKSLSSFNEDDLDSCFHESSHSKSSHKRDAPQRTASTSSKTIEKKKKNQKKETSSNKSKSGHSRKLLTNMIESTNDVRVVRDKSERSAHQPFLQLEVVIPSPN